MFLLCFSRGNSLTPYSKSVPAVIAKASAVYNPIIYAIIHPRYRYSKYIGMCMTVHANVDLLSSPSEPCSALWSCTTPWLTGGGGDAQGHLSSYQGQPLQTTLQTKGPNQRGSKNHILTNLSSYICTRSRFGFLKHFFTKNFETLAGKDTLLYKGDILVTELLFSIPVGFFQVFQSVEPQSDAVSKVLRKHK